MNEEAAAFENGTITAKGPVSSVPVHSHMRSGPHSLYGFPLDMVIVVELSFLLAEQVRQIPSDGPLAVTPQSLLTRLRELGVKSGNGSRLVGRDAVYEAFARLRAKGYIRRLTLKDQHNKVTGVAYEFYEWPAWNPEAPSLHELTSSQVGATSGNAGSGNAGKRTGNRTSRTSSQVGATSGNAGSGNAGKRTSSQVGATSGNAGSPPHPPEEVTTSSPNPLTRGTDAPPSQTEEEEEEGRFAPEETAAAENLLQLLDAPWAVGKLKARGLAPLLLSVMRDQGWPSINEVDHRLLRPQLMLNPKGLHNHANALKTDRIPNLVRYEVVTRKPSGASDRPSAAPVAVECDKGCDRGYMEHEDGVAPCSCLPLRQTAAN